MVLCPRNIRIGDWQSCLEGDDQEGFLKSVRRDSFVNRPLGVEAFVSDLEKRFQLRLARGKLAGRLPRGKKSTISGCPSYLNDGVGMLPVNDFIQRMIASRKELFWDKGPLDPEKDKFVIVERVLEFGTERETLEVLSCYGDEMIRDVVRNSRNLSPKTVNYFAKLLDVSLEATRCFSDVSPRIWQPF